MIRTQLKRIQVLWTCYDKCYYYHVFILLFMFSAITAFTLSTSAACRGRPLTLTGSRGQFGVNSTQYEENVECAWKIVIDESKVK